jgi:hypothetical protein
MNKSTQNSTNNIFTFFSNGQNVNSIKNQAKKEHKSGKHPSRSSALNTISKSICDKPFNKAVSDFSLISPYTVSDTLFLPLFSNDKKYIISVNKNGLSINDEFKLTFPIGVSLGDVAFNIIQKLSNGWSIDLVVNNKIHGQNQYKVDVKTTDEGIISDLWLVYDDYDMDSVNSTGAMYNEMLEIFPIYTNINFEGLKYISDMRVAIQLNHKTIDERTEIASYKGMVLSLVGAVQILTPDGKYLYGNQVWSIVEDGICSKNDLIKWLNGSNDIVNIDILNRYECIHNPWFDICYEDGEPISECFTSISSDPMKLFNEVLNIEE